MKRLAINVTICLGSFAVGVAVASVLTWIKAAALREPPRVTVAEVKPQLQPSPTVVSEPAESPFPEVAFAGPLLIVPKVVKLQSERLHYEVDVKYPRIVGSNAPHIRRLNERIEQLVTKQYQWLLNPPEADLRRYGKDWPEVLNFVDIYYDITLATDSFLSIGFYGYSYGIGAAHAVQFSFVVNYDLAQRKELKLSDLFISRSKYLEFITEYCTTKISSGSNGGIVTELSPRSFKSWNITPKGIRFIFDACTVLGCSSGSQEVEIPFDELRKFLKASLVSQRN